MVTVVNYDCNMFILQITGLVSLVTKLSQLLYSMTADSIKKAQVVIDS
jgi:hypothetical protein